MAADYVLTTLKQGLKRIEAGWTKGQFKKRIAGGKTQWCMLGAIDSDWEAKQVLSDIVGSRWLATWNDRPSRTKAQVVAAFKKAISRRSKMIA